MAERCVLVGQSGGPTAAINASLAGVIAAGILEGARVEGMRYGIQGFLDGRSVRLDEAFVSRVDLDLLRNTPASWLGSCRFKLPALGTDDVVYQRLFQRFEELGASAVLYIGGNDSMDTIKKLSDYAIVKGYTTKFIGVPKTIDNDLALTDHTPGYGSAAKYIGTSTKEIIRDSNALEYGKGLVTVIEIMGRNAGWLTGAAALSKGEDCEGPDLIYLPELAFDVEKFVEKVKGLLEKKQSVVVAVSEGIRLADGRYVCELTDGVDYVDAFGHKQLSGTANYLACRIANELGCKARGIELSTLQRAASHLVSRIDIIEAYQVGGAAVKAADEGDTGEMVILERISDDPYQCTTSLRNVHKVSNVEKVVPRKWINEDGDYVTEEFLNYVKPLIQGDVPPIMVDGIPRHLYHNDKW